MLSRSTLALVPVDPEVAPCSHARSTVLWTNASRVWTPGVGSAVAGAPALLTLSAETSTLATETVANVQLSSHQGFAAVEAGAQQGCQSVAVRRGRPEAHPVELDPLEVEVEVALPGEPDATMHLKRRGEHPVGRV